MTTLINGAEVADPRLGRIQQRDPRSRSFPIRKVLPPALTPRSMTWLCTAYLDQGNVGACVGFAIAHEGIARPDIVPDITHDIAMEVYHRAQELDPWPGECVDLQTECLTNRGFLTSDKIQEGDYLLGFDLEQQGLQWAKIEKVHRYDNAPYRVFEHDQFSVGVTDNHKWLVGNRITVSPATLVKTTDLKSQHMVIRSARSLMQPTRPMVDDDLVELVGWVITEGSYRGEHRRGNSITVSQKSYKGRVTELMKRLSVATGYEQEGGCHVWSINGKLAEAVRTAAPNRAVTAEWLQSLTIRQLKLFVETCILADGHISNPSSPRRHEAITFSQKRGPILDSFLMACCLAGFPVSRASTDRGVNENVETWTLRRSNTTDIRKMTVGPTIHGPVWCPQSPLGTFVARRGGAIFITGNSYEGTSVLAGLKAGMERGWYQEFRWAFSLNDLILGVGHHGPAVLGVNWYDSLFNPDPDGMLHVSGNIAGGHSLLAVGVSIPRRKFRLHNSWGKSWGLLGDAFISFGDMERLLLEQGEAAFPRPPSRGTMRRLNGQS